MGISGCGIEERVSRGLSLLHSHKHKSADARQAFRLKIHIPTYLPTNQPTNQPHPLYRLVYAYGLMGAMGWGSTYTWNRETPLHLKRNGAMLCNCAVLCCAVLCCAVLCYAMLYCATWLQGVGIKKDGQTRIRHRPEGRRGRKEGYETKFCTKGIERESERAYDHHITSHHDSARCLSCEE